MGRLLDRLTEHLVSNGSHAVSVDADAVFDVLSSSRRRAVIRYMVARPGEGPFTVSDVAEALAAWETGKTVNALNGTERKRVYTALYQAHLPKLAQSGLVDYNKNRGRVDARPELMAVSHLVGESLHEPISEFRATE